MLLSPLLLSLSTGAEEKAPPVIDIDGTVLLQFVLFLLLFFILRSLLFRPYLEMRRQRAAGIEGAREQAQMMEMEAEALQADYERRFRAARGQADEERGRLRGEGIARERELLAEARGVVQVQIQTARRRIAEKVAEAEKELAGLTEPLAQRIASKILGREL